MSKVYVGIRKSDLDPQVTVDGQKLFNYDRFSEGHEWGYAGTGPRALALSILSDHRGLRPHELTDDEREPIEALSRRFRDDVVSELPREGFRLTTEEIDNWLAHQTP